jgi:hypothetical protein
MGTFQMIEIGQPPAPQTQQKSPEISEEKRAKVTNLATIRQNTGKDRSYKVRL